MLATLFLAANEQAQADVQELRERVAYDVRQQLLAVTRAENRIRNLPDRRQALQALQRAEQALLAAPQETAQGLVAQVTNSRQAWRSAETATADAYIDYNNAVFRLKRLIGEPPEKNGTVASRTDIPHRDCGSGDQRRSRSTGRPALGRQNPCPTARKV